MNQLARDAMRCHWSTVISGYGGPAVIARGAATCTPVVGFGRSDAEAVTTREARFEADRQDFIVLVDEYAPVLAGDDPVPTPPAIGDQFTATVGGEVLICEVRPGNTTEQHCRHTDQSRTAWRVFTVIVGRSPV